jgi:arylsulfatase A-like enzyme
MRFLLALALALAAQAADRPHVVFLLADDLGRADVGFMGARQTKTPHLDALAQAGAVLDAFYVQPLCSPTRAALLTGRYPMRHGLQAGVVRPWAQYGLPLEERTLPQALREAGYATAIVGKWHLGHCAHAYLPTQRGFEHQYGHYNGALDYFTHLREGGFDWHRDDRECRDEGYTTHLIAREAVRLIVERDQTRPLFLYVPFNAVHAPHQVPASYTAPFAHLKGDRRLYAGMLAAMDEAVGQIAAAIDAAGMRQDTLFIFASDNGGPAPGRVTDNGPLRAGKGSLYEGGVRVCAFATWAGKIPAGSVVRAPLHIVDWYPTLLRLAGAKIEQSLPLDGRDAWAALTEGASSPHEDILVNVTPGAGALRMGDWKLVLGGGLETEDENETARPRAGKKPELFNLANDPGEKTNLAAAEPARLHEMSARLAVYAQQQTAPKNAPKAKDFKSPAVWGQFD